MDNTDNSNAVPQGQAALVIGDKPSLDENIKLQREYGNDYSKLALQGGHKDLLVIDGKVDNSDVRRQKGSQDESEYTKVAREGGHRGLLHIEENQKKEKVKFTANGGDWYKQQNSPADKNPTSPKKTTPPKKVASPRSESASIVTPDKCETTPKKPTSPRNKSTVFGGSFSSGPDQDMKVGKKKFEHQTERRDAPFATGI